MVDILLTQAEADALIALDKRKVDEREWDYPMLGGSLTIPLASSDRREQFILDISRGRIDLSKNTFQKRARQIIVLVRLDLGGPPHRNPDGEEVPCPHLHVYREGYGDKWALPIPPDLFSDPADLWQVLQDFMSYCNITEPPHIKRGLFI